MTQRSARYLAGVAVLCVPVFGDVHGQTATPRSDTAYTTIEIPFTSHDGHTMVGKLTLPSSPGPHPVVVSVQTAEAQTVDSRIDTPRGPIEFFDLYRREFASRSVGFFSYEGRGVRTGPKPPRYSQIDWPAYNTSTLDNKVRDAMAAVRVVRKQAGVDPSRMVLRGHSEGSLLAAEAASRMAGELSAVVLSGIVIRMSDALRFQVTDGTFRQHQGHWDANRDGTITAAEFQADPRGIRKLMPPEVSLGVFDTSGDGQYTVEDARVRGKPFVAAIEARNPAGVMPWLKATAAMEIPEGWLADHFEHPPIDTFLVQLQVPVGIFQGDADQLTPASDVRMLEARMKAASKSNIEFQYFPGLDHSLRGLEHLFGSRSAAYMALFDYVGRQVAAQRR